MSGKAYLTNIYVKKNTGSTSRHPHLRPADGRWFAGYDIIMKKFYFDGHVSNKLYTHITPKTLTRLILAVPNEDVTTNAEYTNPYSFPGYPWAMLMQYWRWPDKDTEPKEVS